MATEQASSNGISEMIRSLEQQGDVDGLIALMASLKVDVKKYSEKPPKTHFYNGQEIDPLLHEGSSFVIPENAEVTTLMRIHMVSSDLAKSVEPQGADFSKAASFFERVGVEESRDWGEFEFRLGARYVGVMVEAKLWQKLRERCQNDFRRYNFNESWRLFQHSIVTKNDFYRFEEKLRFGTLKPDRIVQVRKSIESAFEKNPAAWDKILAEEID